MPRKIFFRPHPLFLTSRPPLSPLPASPRKCKDFSRHQNLTFLAATQLRDVFSHGAKLRKRIHTHKEKGEYLQKCGFGVPKNQKTLSPVTQKRQKDAPETSVNKPKVPKNLRPFFRKISFSVSYLPKLRRHNMR